MNEKGRAKAIKASVCPFCLHYAIVMRLLFSHAKKAAFIVN